MSNCKKIHFSNDRGVFLLSIFDVADGGVGAVFAGFFVCGVFGWREW